MIQIYHNPRCSKSRQTLELIKQQGIEPEIIEYLKTPASQTELKSIVKKLGISASDLLRKKEDEYKLAALDKDSTESQCLAAMHKYPKLMERPIVINGEKAAIGRPPESVLEIL